MQKSKPGIGGKGRNSPFPGFAFCILHFDFSSGLSAKPSAQKPSRGAKRIRKSPAIQLLVSRRLRERVLADARRTRLGKMGDSP
jgi:hypothetical protein